MGHRRTISIGRTVLWSALFACLAIFLLEQVQRTDWYKNRLYHQLLEGKSEQRWSAAVGLSRLGAQERLLMGLRQEDAEVREAARRALESSWFLAAGDKAYKMTQRAHQATQQEEYVLALEILNELVRDYPDFAEGWNRRASLYWQVGDYEKSMLDCHKALALNPNHYGAWQGIGVCQLRLGNLAGACQSLRAALRIDPHDAATRRSLSRCEALLRTYPGVNDPTLSYQEL